MKITCDSKVRFAATAARTLLIGCALLPGTLHAQDVSSAAPPKAERVSAPDASGEILVTATKARDPENVQDVPIAITAFNEATLEAFKVRDLSGLSFQVPGVTLDQVGTFRGSANSAIRGLGINSSIPSVDPTVGVFLDGVYLGVNGGVVFDLLDLASVEVLRGPQGVLFGRNVTGGAVVVNTGNPTGDFRGKLRTAVDGPVDGGRGGANFTVSGVISGPILEDTLLFKLGAYYNKDEGYFRNLANGSNQGRAETTNLRGALEGRFGGLTLLGKLDWFKSDGDGASSQNRGFFARDGFALSIDNRGFYDTTIWTGSLTATADLGPGTLTNVFGWRKYDISTSNDIDGTPLPLFNSATGTAQEQFSNELRYALSTGPLDLTIGGFWFTQDVAYTEQRALFRNLPVNQQPPQSFGGGRQDHEVLGLFANAQYKLAGGLSAIAGLRWNQETKDAAVTFITARPACSVIAGTCSFGTGPYRPGIENDGFRDKVRFRNLSPKLGLQYAFADSQIYSHWSRGYRSGGYNFRIANIPIFNRAVLATGDLGYDEEKVDSYEIGGKFQTAGKAFTLNVAGYVTKVGNMQREVNLSDPGTGVVQNILNTADATITGFEAEARMRVSDNLAFTANLSVIDADYDTVLFDISGDGRITDADGALDLPRVVPVTVGAGLVHELELGQSSVVTRVNYQYRDRAAYTDDNLGWLNELSMLEVNVSWDTPVNGLSLSLYGRNLLDEVQEGGDTQIPFGGPLSSGVRQPFGNRATAGTFSPLMKGRQVGLEAVFEL